MPSTRTESDLAGKAVCIAGRLTSLGRAQVKESLAAAGARVTKSVSSKTDLVVLGDRPGLNLKLAMNHHVPLVTEPELAVWLRAGAREHGRLAAPADEVAALGGPETLGGAVLQVLHEIEAHPALTVTAMRLPKGAPAVSGVSQASKVSGLQLPRAVAALCHGEVGLAWHEIGSPDAAMADFTVRPLQTPSVWHDAIDRHPTDAYVDDPAFGRAFVRALCVPDGSATYLKRTDGEARILDQHGLAPRELDLPIQDLPRALRATRGLVGWGALFWRRDRHDPSYVNVARWYETWSRLFPDASDAELEITPNAQRTLARVRELRALEGWPRHAGTLIDQPVLVLDANAPPLREIAALRGLGLPDDAALHLLSPTLDSLCRFDELTERAAPEQVGAMVDAAIASAGRLLSQAMIARLLIPVDGASAFTLGFHNLPSAEVRAAFARWGFTVMSQDDL